MTFLGDILGSTIGGMFGLIGANSQQMMSYKDNKKLQENQAKLNYNNSVKYAQWSAENTPSMNRAGLTKAGYNPMLAVQNSTGGVNAGSFAGSAHVDTPDVGSAVSAGVANAQSLQRLHNETETAKATQDQAYAMADKAKVEKNSLIEKLPFISQREKAEIANVEKDSLLKESQIHNIDETTRFIEKNYELQKILGLAGIDVQRAGVGAQYANARAAQTAAEAKTLMQYAGKWTEDKFKSLKGSKFGKDLAKLGRLIYRR